MGIVPDMGGSDMSSSTVGEEALSLSDLWPGTGGLESQLRMRWASHGPYHAETAMRWHGRETLVLSCSLLTGQYDTL